MEENMVLLKRIEKLEKSNEKITKLFASCIIASIILLFIAMSSGMEKVIRGTAFILENNNNEPLAVMINSDEGPMLKIYDKEGKQRLFVGMILNQPVIMMADKNEKPMMTISSIDEMGSLISLKDSLNNKRLEISTIKYPNFTIFNEEETEKASLFDNKDGTGLIFLNKENLRFSALSLNDNKSSAIALYSQGILKTKYYVDENNTMLSFHENADEDIKLALYDGMYDYGLNLINREGKILSKVVVDKKNGPILELNNEKGKTIFKKP